jgi:DnaJ-class molecular chaperone
MSCGSWWLLLLELGIATAQFQFEMPAEMLQGMFGGQMGGGQQRKQTEWPKSISSEIEPAFDFLYNTEWKGKTAKYLLRREGMVESPLKECQHEGSCKWAANKNRIMINTPTLKVVKFKLVGLEDADKKKLANKDESELKKLKLVTEKPSKSGKHSELNFDRVDMADVKEMTSADLYKVLELEEGADASQIKSKYRRLSVKHHPDKGGDVKVFNEIRDAYEILSDADSKRYYDLGGLQLVRNMETAFKEVEGKAAQMDAQLNQVPKHHPQRAAFEHQIAQQKAQLDKKRVKPQLEDNMRSDTIEVHVQISAKELVMGAPSKEFAFNRLMLCRGCSADPEAPHCTGCGRCPPEKVQVPKYANTPFGRQVVGMSEREQESRERCREIPVPLKLRIPQGAVDGKVLQKIAEIGHQTPGKLPGHVEFKVQRGAPGDQHTAGENDLHTVMAVSLEQAVFGFTATWIHLDGSEVSLDRSGGCSPDEVVRFKRKGIGKDGHLYVRIFVKMPNQEQGASELRLQRPQAATMRNPPLEAEREVYLHDGKVWRRWTEREQASSGKRKQVKREEL